MNKNNKINNKVIGWVAIVVGILLIIVAVIYWTTPAGSLPAFIPGYESGVTTVHFKHGLGSFILALALFAYAWFTTGKKE